MSYRRNLLRTTVAALCAAVLSIGVVPVGPAVAAPVLTGRRCDEKFGLTGGTPGKLPAGNSKRAEADWDEYEFVNQRQSWDNLRAPTPQEIAEAGEDPAKWKATDPKSVWASYNRRQASTNPYTGSFTDWLNDVYIENAARRIRGEAFHRKVVEDFKLVGPDWLCEVQVKDGNKVIRTYDAVNQKTKEFVEFKSGGAHSGGQIPGDRKVLQDPRFKDYSLRYVFGQEQEKKTGTALKNLGAAVGDHADGRPRVTTYEHRSTPVVRFERTEYTKFDTTLNPKPVTTGQGSRGGLNDMVNQSKPTPETMRRLLERQRAEDVNGQRVRGPGGVDFSTLELRFVGTPAKGEGLNYSFTAEKMPDPEENPGYGGQEKAQLISDSFFTWLALTPEKFWVNLNPDEPDRIMDAKFGRTDAGRVLLEADLQMKHDFAAFLNPETEIGRKFWDRSRLTDGLPCLHGIRNWIEPEPAQVREQDGGIYILDAPLKVNSVPQEVDFDLPGDPCEPTKAQIEHNQKLVDELIIPAVEKKINTDSSYADLRRVYTSRVAAEWIRLQDAKKATDYRAIINSDDASRWPIRGEAWNYNDTWQRYLKSYRDGDYKFEWEAGGQVYIYTYGGVDFSQSPKKNVTKQQFTAQHQYLPRGTKTSVQTMTDDAENADLLLLGGNTNAEPSTPPSSDPGGNPGDGSDDGSDDGSGDGSDNGSGGSDGNGSGDDNAGGLPITGGNIPVPLLISLALTLIALGGGLTYWARRRRSTFIS